MEPSSTHIACITNMSLTIHDDIKREVLDKEQKIVPHRRVVEGVQDGGRSAIGSCGEAVRLDISTLVQSALKLQLTGTRLPCVWLLLLPELLQSLLLLLLLLLLRFSASARLCAECSHCTISFGFLSLCFPISHLLPLRLYDGPVRPRLHREPLRPPFWLLARFVDGLAPSACVVRRPHGSTMRSSTVSCVYSTHRSPLALNSFPSFVQRIFLALSSLLFLRTPPGPELSFLLPFAPPEPSLLPLALPEL